MTPNGAPELEDLLARARAGETAAFDAIARSAWPRLVRSATALSRDAEAARDLAQETLLEAWKCLARYDGRHAFAAWLHGILRHRFLKMLRRGRSRPCLALVDAPPEPADPAAADPAFHLAAAEDAGRLRLWVGRLPEEQRRVVELRFFADASLAEIAAVLGCPEGTVKSRLHHGLRTLREKSVNLFTAAGEREMTP